MLARAERIPAITWAAGLIVLGLMFALPAFAATPTFPTLTGRVVDDANVLSPTTRANLTEMLARHEQATGEQVVVVTLASLQGLPIEDYGYQLGRYWGIGQKGKNTGALLIVAPNDHRVRIEVGYGLEGKLTDAQSSVIISRDLLPAFRRGDYDAGVTAATAAILTTLGGDAAAAPDARVHDVTWQSPPFNPLILIGLILLGANGIFFLLSALFRRRHPAYGNPLLRSSSTDPSGAGMIRRYPRRFYGGGGFGGGFGGGGGGGFSGGGGSFGAVEHPADGNVMPTPLTPEDRLRIGTAANAIRQRTGTEISVIVLRASDRYAPYPFLWASLTAVFAAAMLALFTPQMALRSAFLIEALVLVTLAIVGDWMPIRMRLAPRRTRHAVARALAHREFATHLLGGDPNRRLVVLFVSLGEHYVEIIADRATHASVTEGAWTAIIGDFLSAVKGGPLADAILAAMASCEKTLPVAG